MDRFDAAGECHPLIRMHALSLAQVLNIRNPKPTRKLQRILSVNPNPKRNMILRVPGRKTAEGDRREAKSLVWKVVKIDKSNVLELCFVTGTLAATSLASMWRLGRLQSVVGLPEPECVADLSVAEKLGLDLTMTGLEARRVSVLVACLISRGMQRLLRFWFR